MVQYGADFNKEDIFGLTPLYLAKTKGQDGEDVFNYLLGEGAAYNELEAANVRLAQIAAEAAIAATMAAIDVGIENKSKKITKNISYEDYDKQLGSVQNIVEFNNVAKSNGK